MEPSGAAAMPFNHRSAGSVAAGFGSLWVVNDYDITVSRIDPAGGSVQDTIPVDADPTAITTGHGFVWVVCAGTRRVLRIDPRVNRSVGRPVPVGNGNQAAAVIAVASIATPSSCTIAGPAMRMPAISSGVLMEMVDIVDRNRQKNGKNE